MAKKKNLSQKLPVGKTAVLEDTLTRWLGLCGIFIASSLFIFSLDTAQIKKTLFYIASAGTCAFWLNGLIKTRVNIFTKRNFFLLFPFLLYFLYTAVSFFFHPYGLARSGDLLRFVSCGFLFCAVVFNFDSAKSEKFLNYLYAAAWCVGWYGLLQIIDIYIFSGADIFKWTDFFQERIFSTIANPNFLADFCLLAFFALLGPFIKKPSKSKAVLLVLLALNIAFTLSKGAWLAFAAGLVLFSFIWFNYFSDKNKSFKLKYNIFLSGVIVAALAAVFFFGAKRMQSVNFRLSTWRSAVEMVEAAPITGMGKGSFKYIYPAYKRPEIFYMEGLHNAETQHAENYYLEQACELGILGLGLFVLVLLWQVLGFFSKLKKVCVSKEDRNRALVPFGCFCAAAAVYMHNFVDISIYFVSTAYFLVILNGIIFLFNFGPLDQRPANSDALNSAEKKEKLYWIFAFIAGLFILVLAYFFLAEFYEMTAPILKGRVWLFCFYWAFFLAAILYTLWLFYKEIRAGGNLFCPVVFLAAAGLMYLAFQPFRSSFYCAAGAGLAEKNLPEAASFYNKAIKTAPLSPSLYQFSGVVFQNRANFEKANRPDTLLAKTNRPEEGDPAEGLFNDYDRALRQYKKSLSFIPNDTLIHYNLGALYHDIAKEYARRGDIKEAQKYYELSEASLKKALLLDPVYDNIYYHLANIALEHQDYRTAANWVNLYIQGPEEVSNPLYLATHRNNAKAVSSLKSIKAAGGL